jgi:hypothetical protein
MADINDVADYLIVRMAEAGEEKVRLPKPLGCEVTVERRLDS